MIERNITALKARAEEARKQAFQPVAKPLIEAAFIEEMNNRGYENHHIHFCTTTKDYIITVEGSDIVCCYSAKDTWQAESKFWIGSDELAREIDVDIYGDAEVFEDVLWSMSQGFEALTKTIKIKI